MTRVTPFEHAADADAGCEHVVLLDDAHQIIGDAPKAAVHHRTTPLHLGFSCHVLDADGRALVSRRATCKATWPGAWTNACCGHPAPGESLRGAVERRLAHELGVRPVRVSLALADFAYRAVMPDGTVEHEVCPVVLATIDGPPRPNPDEVEGVAWLPWAQLCRRAGDAPETLTPWAVEQLALLGDGAPRLLVDGGPDDALLDEPPPFRSRAATRPAGARRFSGPGAG